MVKSSKATKKFVRSKLAGALKQRKEYKEAKKLQERIKNREAKRKRVEPEHEEEELDLGQTKIAKTTEAEDDLDVDQFLDKGFFDAMNHDSDEEDEETSSEGDDEMDRDGKESQPKSKSKSKATSSSTKSKLDEQDMKDELSQHKKDLDELRKDSKQAEFLEYLEKEAPGLLDFDDLDDEESGNEDGEGESKKQQQLTLTLPMFESWKNLLLKEKSLPAFRRIVAAFRSACHLSDEDSKEDSGTRGKNVGLHFKITDAQVFNEVVVFCLQSFGKGLDLVLGKNTSNDGDDINAKSTGDDSEDEEGEANGKSAHNQPKKQMNYGFNAARFQRWPKVKDVVKSFFTNLNHFIGQLSDSKMINFVLQNLERIVKYLSPFSILQKKLLKVLLSLWSSGSESVRILAFFNIRRMALDLPYPFIDHVLKGVYLTYVRNCKFVNRATITLITFLCNCVVEIYGLDFVSSYQHAFVYIRELASHLRGSFTSNKKQDRKNIYNFQYIHSVNAWVRVLAAYPNQEQLSLLYYPLVQIIQGTIAYQPTNRYFPLRLACVKMLNQLATSSQSYINCASYILEILDCSDMYKKPKQSMEKAFDLKLNLKASKQLVGTKLFQDSIFEEAFLLLVEYLALYSRSIAFPELVIIISKALAKFKKASHQPFQTKKIATLQQKITQTVQLIQSKRNHVNFSPSELASLSKFLGDDPTPMTRYNEELIAQAKPIEIKRQMDVDSKNNAQSDGESDDESSSLDDDQDVKEWTSSEGEESADDENSDKMDTEE